MSTEVKPISASYHAYSLELFGELMIQLAKIVRQPDAPNGHLIILLDRLIHALRKEPYQVVTESERLLRLRADELLEIAYQSVNGPDTNEGRARLYTIVTELRAMQGKDRP